MSLLLTPSSPSGHPSAALLRVRAADRSPRGRHRLGSAASLAALALLLTACAPGAGAEPGPASGAADGSSPAPSGIDEPVNIGQRESRTEVGAIAPRAVLSHSGGLITLDTETGEVVHDEELPGFWRLNNAGDGQHVMVTTGDGFEVYNAGIDAVGHGGHFHYYESEPGLSGIRFAAPLAGHVVTHHGRTTLFADGDGSIQTFTSEHLKEGPPRTQAASTEDAHHGVALELADGTLLTTQGTEGERDTVQVKDGETVLAQTEDCPGVHGETTAAPTADGDVVVLGCENGPVIYRDGDFHKVAVDGDYVRTGNLAGAAESSIVLADMKVEAEADLERPTRVALIDTRTDSLRAVELGSPYWFRSLARGPEGEALVLTYDGELNVVDERTGEVTDEIPVVEPWQEHAEWQQPGPILKTAGSMAYVTDAQEQKLVIVDLRAGEVIRKLDLTVSPVEMAVVTGHPEAPETRPQDTTAGEGERAERDQGHQGHEGHEH